MFKDKLGNAIKVGDIISDGFNAGYLIKEIDSKLFADNSGHMFPLDSPNYDLKKFRIVRECLR